MMALSKNKIKLLALAVFVLVIWKSAVYFSLFDRYQSELGADTGDGVIKVSVYYEALCSDSRHFVIDQLMPTYEKLQNHIDLNLVPYGKATTIFSNNKYTFTCQHLHLECEANIIHACVLAQPLPMETKLKYVACMIKDNMNPDQAGQKCAQVLAVPYDPVAKCASSDEGSLLLKEHGDKTNALSPKISFVPTVEINDSQSVELSKLLKDLQRELCKLLKNPSSVGC